MRPLFPAHGQLQVLSTTVLASHPLTLHPLASHPFLSGELTSMMTRLSAMLLVLVGTHAADAQQWRLHEQRGPLEFFSEVPLPLDRLVAELTAVQTEVNTQLKLPDISKTVQIIVFRSMTSYRAYLSTRIPEALNRRAIFYSDGDQSQIYVVNHSGLVTDLRHEFTHVLLHESLPFIPLWIDEGVAEFFEQQPAQRLRSSRLSAVKWKCRTGWSPDLSRLENLATASGMTTEDYRDSWAWVHYLLNDSRQTRSLLQDYLAAISAGGAPGTFSEWSAARNPTATKRVGSYFRRFRFSVLSGTRR